MKRILVRLTGGLLIGAAVASYAELAPPTPEEKAAASAKAEKDAAAKAKAAKELAQAQDKAVANHRKNKGSSAGGPTAQSAPDQNAAPARQQAPGAGHATVNSPTQDLTGKEAQTEMPTPGQANDHSSTARETVPSGR
jgi:hypothetical protein